ncbi:MAG: hypothetical protein ACJ76J_17360 [Thermoanaerobaculia bacterium]
MRRLFSSTPVVAHGRLLTRLCTVVVAAAVLLACPSKSPEEKLLKAAEPLGSWLAALEMAGRKWQANSVPASFVGSSVSAAGDQFEKVAKEAAKSEARPAMREPLRRLIAEAETAGDGLLRAVEWNDRQQAVRAVALLAGLRARFEAWKSAAGGTS